MKNLALVIPVYNEEKTIQKVLEDWSIILDHSEFDIIIIDDGSTDRTQNILIDLKKKIQNLILISKKNEGHGPAVISGYEYAIKNDYDVIYETDDDNLIYDDFDDILNNSNNINSIIKDKNNNWINIFKYFTKNKACWPRGLPITNIHNKYDFEIKKNSLSVSIIQGLVDNDPDVDSLYRLIKNDPIAWEKNKLIKIKYIDVYIYSKRKKFKS